MALVSFPIVLILIAKGFCAVPAPTQPSGSQALTLTAEPSAIHDSFTPELTVNCSINPHASDMDVLLSIVLTKTYPEEHHQNFNEIAIVASLSSPHLQVKDELNAAVSGQILVDKPSYLIFKWKYPSRKATGRYMCTAHGMDKTGHPVKFIAEAQVIEKEVDLQMVLEKMRLMEINQEVLVSRLNETTTQLSHMEIDQEVLVSKLNQTTTQLNHMEMNQDGINSLLNETIVQLEMEIQNCNCNKTMVKFDQTSSELATLSLVQTKAQTELENLKTQLNNTQLDIKDASFTYNGHKYIVSREFYRNIDVAQAICALFGGYLVEIDDENEYQFINKTLTDLNINDNFLIGLTDKEHEGTWTYLKSPRSTTSATFFKWAPNEPNSGVDANCAGLWTVAGNLMIDDYCYFGTFDRCICEID